MELLKSPVCRQALMSDVELVEDTLRFGQVCLDKQQSIMPMIVGIKDHDDHSEVIALAFTGGRPSDEVLQYISTELKSFGADRYATLMEAWFTEGKEMPKLRPSQSEARKEAVCVSVCDETGVLAFALREIVRDDKGKPSIAPKDVSEAYDEKPEFGGRFTELLQ